MARSLSNAKIFSASLADAISAAVARHGYSAAASSPGAVAKTGITRSTVMATAKKTGESGEKVSWVPDPKTGYYRPENRADEIDVAELRAMLLKQQPQRKH